MKNDLNLNLETDLKTLSSITTRAHYISHRMIYEANQRKNKEKGDPKVGGHSSASSSCLHIMGAIHLLVKTGFDYIVNKPHASPVDHAYNYLLNLFLHKDFSRFSPKEAKDALFQLRAFPSTESKNVFQSYHSHYDPDHYHFLPTGTVGIPPVNLGYLAQAYYLAEKQGYNSPSHHFWALIGDSEFREGSLLEAAPDLAEKEVGNLTWIIDYNRQSLDGHRMNNPHTMLGNDANRIERTMEANGWKVFQLKHGQKRLSLFNKKGGQSFKDLLEKHITDYELQALLLMKEKKKIRIYLKEKYSSLLKDFLPFVSDQKLFEALHDLGGHDISLLAQVLKESKSEEFSHKPSIVIAHTIKGWGLKMAAMAGNHSTISTKEELESLKEKAGLKEEEVFSPFEKKTKEGLFLKKRGDLLYENILEQENIKRKNERHFSKKYSFQTSSKKPFSFPESFDINLKMVHYPHTQWMLGQMTSKLTRIANTPSEELSDSNLDQAWKAASEAIVFMSPDVGTSTNLNPSMDKKVFGASVTNDIEEKLGVKDTKSPDLLPLEDPHRRFLRFEIAEASSMSCLGSFGYMKEALGVPLLPLMTVYDFFIKRALDQYFYNLYLKSSFILVGTPSGVTLSPEGAQHAWKSDFQIPNQITWEPFYCVELEWIIADAMKRHFEGKNKNRSGVLIRCVTRGVNQKAFLKHLKTQKRFKLNLPDKALLSPDGSEIKESMKETMKGALMESKVPSLDEKSIFKEIRKDVLEGAYFLIDYRGYAGYEPGDNVVHIFTMGSPSTEAIEASSALLKKGIYANVIVVTSPDLLLGTLGEKTNYYHLKKTLCIDGNLYLKSPSSSSSFLPSTFPELITLAGQRIPIVSVHDGEVGILDNIGSLVGVKQVSLAVKKHSLSGTPKEIYKYHHIDSQSILEAVEKALFETASEKIQISSSLFNEIKNKKKNS